MKRKLSIMIFCLMTLCLQSFVICQSVDAQLYTIIDLGTLPDCVFAEAAKINEAGSIAGTSGPNSNPSDPDFHAFLWTKQGGMMDLGSLYGGVTVAAGINNRTQVIGNENYEFAFLWSIKTGMLALGTLGGNYSKAQGINERGQIVGYSDDSTGRWRAFLWDERDGMQDIDPLGDNHTYAWDINDAGHIVGYSSVPGSYTDAHAFIWTKQKGMQDLGTLGGESAHPHSINNSGHFVGFIKDNDSQGHAFLWTDENGVEDLGTLGGSTSSAHDISELDQIVGYSYTSYGESHAFLWDRINGMQDLNDLIPNNSGWVLLWASGINNAGEIVGVGHLNGGTESRAFLLMPAQ